MDEKKVREAIDFIKTLITAGNGDERLYTAIEALQKQLRLKPEEVYYKECVGYKCPICGNNLKTVYPDCESSENVDCFRCKQRIYWSKLLAR